MEDIMARIMMLDDCDKSVLNCHDVEEVIVRVQTPRQFVEIVKLCAWGVTEWLDHSPQASEADSRLYHESFAHPVLFLTSGVKDTLVFGGGDFALAAEIRRHHTVRRIQIIDWDREFMELAKKHLGTLHRNTWKDNRIRVRVEDVFEYLPRINKKFHVVFGDLVDLPSWNSLLPDAGKHIKNVLAPNGRFVNQSGNGNDIEAPRKAFLAGLAEIAPHFRFFWIYGPDIPFFRYRQFFVIATDDERFNPLAFTEAEINSRIKRRIGTGLEEYSGIRHRGMFALSRKYRTEIRAVLGNKFPQYEYI
ncbi:MAG: putative spermidine synthase [Parcubacteria group bacterium GW2011_GWB1_50_9]|uniref:Polyamine aminopropyltransferase n=2 Tax=Parcubacteria group TaxID=1794811 RepID=A0A0G1YZS6_9BACT|nr:MAG: putative spermidine synthase [Parcubacteria group bacterium GW2011_GWB1_50_9]KKW20522.1 MAG: putative spermidine synthase [Candidatus Adlerbacteria bacterium GW2011_GWC1_50_9]